jgi:hypothetical protein
VLSLVLCGAKSRTVQSDTTNFPHSAMVTKYCSIVLKALSLVLFCSKVQYYPYSTKVLCHYGHNTPSLNRKQSLSSTLNRGGAPVTRYTPARTCTWCRTPLTCNAHGYYTRSPSGVWQGPRVWGRAKGSGISWCSMRSTFESLAVGNSHRALVKGA